MRPAPLKVGFNIGADGPTGFETEASQRMANGVILPLLDIGAVEDSRAKNGRRKEIFTLRDVTEAVRAAIGRKSKPEGQTAYNHTLRETDHWPHRNSNRGAWFTFAEYLQAHGEWVVVVRDTALALEPVPTNMRTWPLASMDLHVAPCMNQPSTTSLLPMVLTPWHYSVRVHFSNSTQSMAATVMPNTPKWWHDWMGIDVGEQFPWSLPTQRIVWETDEYVNLVRSWEDLRRIL